MFLTGILQVFAMLIFMAVYNVFVRAAGSFFELKPVIFTCMLLVATSFTLSLCSGPGKYVTDTLKSWQTWAYGFVLIGAYIGDLYLVKYVSGTEMSLISRLTVPFSLMIAYLLFRRLPQKTDLIGVALIVGGFAALLLIQPHSVFMPVLVIAILTAIVRTFLYVLSETHTESAKAHEIGNIRDRMRVVGAVSFVTSMVFLLLVLAVSLIGHSFFQHNVLFHTLNIPPVGEFFGIDSVLAGLFFGLFFSPFVLYLKWASTYRIKSENVLAILAMLPLLTYAFEALVAHHPRLTSLHTGLGDNMNAILFIAIVMTVGSGLSVFLRVHKQIKAEQTGNLWHDIKRAATVDKASIPAIQHAANAKDDYDIICATLEHTGGDRKKAATLLDMPEDTLYVIYQGKGALALVSSASQHVSRRFRTQVANRDALTGLYNRGGFLLEAKQLLQTATTATLVFIDLNKFKQINDTFGHTAGNTVLQQIADRLLKSYGEQAKISRLGGDEFCLLFNTAINEETCTKALHHTLQKPVHLTQDSQVIPSASIGFAHFPHHGATAEALLAAADKAMYAEKHKES